jgi:hypothetical protein
VYLDYGTVRLRPVSMLVDITSSAFYKCTATFRKQICRRCLRIKSNGFRPVSMLVDITSSSFYKCTATFRMHCTSDPFYGRFGRKCYRNPRYSNFTNYGQPVRLVVEAFGLVTFSRLIGEVPVSSDDKQKRRLTGLVTSCVNNCLLKCVIEGKTEGRI